MLEWRNRRNLAKFGHLLADNMREVRECMNEEIEEIWQNLVTCLLITWER